MKISDVRKTYKSKKDFAVYPRKMVCENKNSGFDAFYISNIKQTKQGEISSLQHYGTAAKKVRKKRHVRKIVKELVVNEEATTYSTNLTPDKSIHVNRAPDLFDLLLKSTSPKNLVPEKPTNNVFDYLQVRTNNTRRSFKTFKSRTKPITRSSSESSGDEDINFNNMTDILKHNFIVEKESKPYEDSIFKISNETSLLKKIIAKNNTINGSQIKSPNISLHVNECNITTTSPLCSTPFQAKYRGKSIYKFSPIPMNKLDVTEECVQDNKTENNISQVRQQNIYRNSSGSPILPCSQSNHRNSTKCSENFVSCQIDDIPEDENKQDSTNSIANSADNNPFLGFSSISYLRSNRDNVSKNIKNNSVAETNESSPILKSSSSYNRKLASFKYNKLNNGDTTNSIQFSNEYEPFIGFTDSDIAKVDEVYVINGSSDESNVEQSNNTIINKSDDNILSTSKSFTINASEDDINSDGDGYSNESDDSNISYNTCVSDDEDALYILGSNFEKQPAVAVEKLNDSVLRYYLNKLPHNYSDPGQSGTSKCSNTSVNENNSKVPTDSESGVEEQESFTHGGSISSNNTTDSNIRNDISGSDVESENYDSTDDYVTDTQNNVKGTGISFVTKRRKADYSNDSDIIALDSSNLSLGSSECNDRTIIRAEEIEVRNEVDKTKVQIETSQQQQELTQNYLENVSCNIYDDSRTSMRMSSRITKSYVPEECCNNVNSEIKPGIVLQPGKKWERSLSIYRRMTIMNESNVSIIDEEEKISRKGRKYRESVINTMEMQEKGPLHDESIRNRRQTIVSKSFRNTIRIVKETNDSRISINDTTVYDKLTGFLNEDCDDTVVELSKLSITDVAHEATVIENFHDTSERVSSARDYVLRRCNQTEAILFDECYPDTVLKNCHKIGEGVYGEVFLWRARDGRARVMKVIPVAGNIKVNGESQKDYQEIISEIVIAMELSALRTPISQIENHFEDGNEAETLDLHTIENATDIFNEVLAVRCVYGNYPSRLLDLWDLYDESKGSENDNPAILPQDQQYIVLELSNAGQDLESYQFNNAEQAYALFLQVAYGLAVAEESYQFEHRDLHWGNVLIAPTEQKYATFVLRGRCYRVLRRGVAGTIIDYSLSRLSLALGANERVALYNELSTDEELFNAVGDYQFEVYRLMRDKLNNEWKTFEPYTNILWLHYTVDKMITALRYKRINTKLHKHYIAKLKGIKNRILDYGSTVQFVLTDNEF